MARETTVKVSDEELRKLHEARQEIFGTDAVPLGEVIAELVDGPQVILDNAQSGGPKIRIQYNNGRHYVGQIYPRKGDTCGEDHEEFIYWDFGHGMETLEEQPRSDGISLNGEPQPVEKNEN